MIIGIGSASPKALRSDETNNLAGGAAPTIVLNHENKNWVFVLPVGVLVEVTVASKVVESVLFGRTWVSLDEARSCVSSDLISIYVDGDWIWVRGKVLISD